MLEFSSILAAVKPQERTDQYKILGALYCLGAQVTPVTAKRIKDLLALHLGNKIPKNTNASLRKYTGLVEPTGNQPLLWKLTHVG